ncbi:hypothetical protein QBC39DRAFT_348723 [Podospora conica]|nr:hypothetical protein QBC39DRAFT_348723 [Schizothecium conicum]
MDLFTPKDSSRCEKYIYRFPAACKLAGKEIDSPSTPSCKPPIDHGQPSTSRRSASKHPPPTSKTSSMMHPPPIHNENPNPRAENHTACHTKAPSAQPHPPTSTATTKSPINSVGQSVVLIHTPCIWSCESRQFKPVIGQLYNLCSLFAHPSCVPSSVIFRAVSFCFLALNPDSPLPRFSPSYIHGVEEIASLDPVRPLEDVIVLPHRVERCCHQGKANATKTHTM